MESDGIVEPCLDASINAQEDRGKIMKEQRLDMVWVFMGGGTNPSAVFTSRNAAEQWIAHHKLCGTLTAYPLDEPIYEWAIDRGFFNATEDRQKTPKFIAGFSSASLEHYHYEDGSP